MKIAYIGMGTNIGEKAENLCNALNSVSHLPKTEISKVSSVYETEPWGFKEQDNFYNICAEIKTDLSPYAFLGACLGIEAAFGRERPFKNSPRIIDIDLLLYENSEINSEELTVPHPRIGERAFVLIPLKEIFPELKTDNADYNSPFELCDKNTVKKIGCIDIASKKYTFNLKNK